MIMASDTGAKQEPLRVQQSEINLPLRFLPEFPNPQIHDAQIYEFSGTWLQQAQRPRELDEGLENYPAHPIMTETTPTEVTPTKPIPTQPSSAANPTPNPEKPHPILRPTQKPQHFQSYKPDLQLQALTTNLSTLKLLDQKSLEAENSRLEAHMLEREHQSLFQIFQGTEVGYQKLLQKHERLQRTHDETIRGAMEEKCWTRDQEQAARITEPHDKLHDLKQTVGEIEIDNRVLRGQVEGYGNSKQALKMQRGKVLGVGGDDGAAGTFEEEKDRLRGQVQGLMCLNEELRRENMGLKGEVRECKRKLERTEMEDELLSEEMAEKGTMRKRRAMPARGGFRPFRSRGHGPFMPNRA